MGTVMGKLFVEVSSYKLPIPATCNLTQHDDGKWTISADCAMNGTTAYDVPDDGYGFFQLIFLGLVYAYILFVCSNLISDGAWPC